MAEPYNVFISYSHKDSLDATRIADALAQRGFTVKNPSEIPLGADWVAALSDSLDSADSVVVLISSPSIWQEKEISHALDRRGVDVIPVLLKPEPIPESLANRTVVDMTQKEVSIDDLARRIQIGHSLDLLDMSPLDFENLVRDILESEGFGILHAPITSDYGYDLIARSPGDDTTSPKEYAIQVKAYQNSRVSVASLHRVAEEAIEKASKRNLLIVTNAQLTSLASDTLRDLTAVPGTPEIRVIDGVQLKYLLLRHPDLALRYSRRGDDGR
ncbi:TIR domain-containing protein [Streptomyces sp. NPDC001388]|uniref:TIR domain-containing protein n=1 Tax=Streptomyces sp. NPDC001388 TaxID=3364568 RepID=UPI003685910D